MTLPALLISILAPLFYMSKKLLSLLHKLSNQFDKHEQQSSVASYKFDALTNRVDELQGEVEFLQGRLLEVVEELAEKPSNKEGKEEPHREVKQKRLQESKNQKRKKLREEGKRRAREWAEKQQKSMLRHKQHKRR